MTIDPKHRYLTRNGYTVTIVRDRGERQVWRWVTSKGYYVTADGRASLAGGDVSLDLVADITEEQTA